MALSEIKKHRILGWLVFGVCVCVVVFLFLVFFFFPGQLLQTKEFDIFVLAQILLEGEVLQNVCSLSQELEKIVLNKIMY